MGRSNSELANGYILTSMEKISCEILLSVKYEDVNDMFDYSKVKIKDSGGNFYDVDYVGLSNNDVVVGLFDTVGRSYVSIVIDGNEYSFSEGVSVSSGWLIIHLKVKVNVEEVNY